MKFLQLNDSNMQYQELNNSIKANKQVFLLIYMEGCGPCNETRPEWKKIENVLNGKTTEKYNNVVVAEMEKDNLKKLTFIKDEPKGFPSMKYISNNGSLQEDFEDSNTKNKKREIDAFIEWIDSKIKKDRWQKGGKRSRKYKRSQKRRRKTKKNRRTYK